MRSRTQTVRPVAPEAETLLAGQNRILRMIATDVPLAEVLKQLVLFIESQAPRVLGSIMLVDETGTRLTLGAVPSLPAEYVKHIESIEIGPLAGSCGTAVHLGMPVVSSDIALDPNWILGKDWALPHGLLACASWPIVGRRDSVLGAFAMYYRKRGRPTADEERLIEISTDLARIAIESTQAEQRMLRLARLDDLTGLLNRRAFNELLDTLIKAEQSSYSLLLIDLDRFKRVNDTLGHDVGDLLIQQSAERLRRCAQPDDVIARVGGDEFFVLTHTADARGLCLRILAAMRIPFQVQGYELLLTASIGLSQAADAAGDARTLLRKVDIALYAAKRAGRNTWAPYEANGEHSTVDSLLLESELRKAITDGGIEVHYQPVVSVDTGAIVRVEALARWRHPERGPISPAVFIPLAEETGLIQILGEQVLETACREVQSWRAETNAELRLAVNLSARQLLSPKLVRRIAAILDRTGLPPGALELEFTESVLIDISLESLHAVEALRRLGITLAIDDFGTGYSSLAYLKRLPLDCLKIDRSFVQDLPGDAESCAIARATIALGHSLGLTVVAEGVENPAQLAFLRSEDCDLFQGFLFSAALPALECRKRIRHDASTPRHAA